MEKDESYKDIIFNPLLPTDFVVKKLVDVSNFMDDIFVNFFESSCSEKKAKPDSTYNRITVQRKFRTK
jgi:hypothetical protein